MDNKLGTMLSCNVRGLRDNLKWKTIFNKFYSAKYDIILLQETHSTPEIEQVWNKEWPGLLLYNHGENNARGTMIAFKPHIKPIIHNTIHDDQGRCIILDCTIFEHRFTFVNIYGPNIDEQASHFYEHIFNEIYASPNDTKNYSRRLQSGS